MCQLILSVAFRPAGLLTLLCGFKPKFGKLRGLKAMVAVFIVLISGCFIRRNEWMNYTLSSLTLSAKCAGYLQFLF